MIAFRIYACVASVAFAALAASAPIAAAQPCGEDNQLACQVQRIEGMDAFMTSGDVVSYWVTVAACNNAFLKPNTDGYCHPTQRSAGLTCCTKVNYADNGHPITEGYHATVDLSEAWIVIPNLEKPGSCNWNTTLKNDMYSVPSWSQIPIYESRLKINANFFDINGINPYGDPCTRALGLTVSNKEIVSPVSQVHNHDTQSIAFMTADYTRSHPGVYAIIDSDVIGKYGAANVQNAVSGYRLIQDGAAIAQPGGIDPTSYAPRAALGLSRDKKTMYLVVINPGNDDRTPTSGGITTAGLADYLIGLGAYDGLTLDGSGSAQLDYYDPQTATRFRSRPSDIVRGFSDRQFRPVPVFLGIM